MVISQKWEASFIDNCLKLKIDGNKGLFIIDIVDCFHTVQ